MRRLLFASLPIQSITICSKKRHVIAKIQVISDEVKYNTIQHLQFSTALQSGVLPGKKEAIIFKTTMGLRIEIEYLHWPSHSEMCEHGM